MARTHPCIDNNLADWMARQHMFFVASAPLDAAGHVNCSPKGGDCLRVVGAHEVVYRDLTGSGTETIAHLRENGRLVMMFCAFEGPPRIVRLHGRGTVVTRNDDRYDAWSALFTPHIGERALIHLHVDRIADSCGYAVPLYAFAGHRDVLDKWSDNRGAARLEQYRREHNAVSIDGLPALDEREAYNFRRNR